MSDSTLRVVQVGCGGYGDFYLTYLLGECGAGLQLVACVDPYIGRCSRQHELRERGIPVYGSIKDIPDTCRADLAIIVSPIHLHVPHTIAAFQRGMHVLCEKPLCATVQDGLALLDAQRASGRLAAIGYQWSYSEAIAALKHDIQSNAFGRLTRAKSLVLWPRGRSYYARASWAGRQKSCSGEWILDSPVNNATSHFLHNMLFAAGPELHRGAQPVSVQAELYRANDIENFATAAVRCITDSGAELLFLTSHAVDTAAGPAFEFECERAHVSYAGGGTDIIAELADGSVRRYGSPDADPYRKLTQFAETIRNGGVPVCGIEAALAQTLCMNGAQESSAIREFPAGMVCVSGTGDDERVFVDGLRGTLEGCYAEWRLPSELGLGWAVSGAPVDLRGYRLFPSR
jgi:predicted dehydrogenase